MYDVEIYVEELSRLLLGFITEFYTDERVIRIDKPEQKNPQDRMEFISFVGQDFAELDFDFEINVSAQAPISRMREQKEAEKLLTIQGQYDFKPAVITPQEYIKMSEFVDSDSIIKRMDMEEARNKIEEAYTVAMQLAEGIKLGASEEALKAKADEMFMQFEQGGIGSTADSSGNSAMSMRQGKPSQ
jgi:hypothetical protein